MFRSRAICLAIVAAGIAGALHAQSRAEYGRLLSDLLRKRPRVDSLMKARAAARATRLALANVRVGDLLLVTLPARQARARELADKTWAIVSTTFGRATVVLRRQVFIPSFGVDEWVQVDQGSIPVPIADTGTATLVQAVATILYQATDSTLHAWMGEPYIPHAEQRVHDEPLYMELVTSPLQQVQRCYAGSIDACRLAFGVEGREDPWSTWYDAADRRRLVDRVFRGSSRREDCVTHYSDAACLAALRLESLSSAPPPFSSAARLSLLATALHAGGNGAYERLLSAHGSLGQRLALAAGSSPEALIVAWRERILSARPKSAEFTPPSAWAAVAWCLVLAALSFRSTRWR